LPLAVLAVITAIETWGSTGMGQIGWTFAVWFAFAAVLGAIGGVAIVGGWPSRAYWLIGAFAVPVPFLALVLFLAAMDLFGH
jgi:hypothetical protein